MPKKYYKQLPRDLRDAIKRYTDAEVDESWRGYGDPEEFASIEAELKESKQALTDLLHAKLAEAGKT